jgi:hypothetical protein
MRAAKLTAHTRLALRVSTNTKPTPLRTKDYNGFVVGKQGPTARVRYKAVEFDKVAGGARGAGAVVLTQWSSEGGGHGGTNLLSAAQTPFTQATAVATQTC